jgi:nucleoside 2-deoxyribosyltransferase
MVARVYLAGPDVFFPDAAAVLARKKEICTRYGLEGLSPLDNEVQADPSDPGAAARTIYAGNARQMDTADAVIANLTPFRGVSADSGTAFELGYCAARRLPLFGYSVDSRSYAGRVRRSFDLPADAAADGDGMAIEDFGLAENLMLIEAILASGGRFIDARDADGGSDNLTAFEACAVALAETLAARRRLAP